MAGKQTQTAWTAKDRAFIRDHAHWTAAAIADALGRSVSQVYNARKRYGGTTCKPTLAGREKEVKRLHAKGLSDRLMALRLQVSETTAHRWRMALGLPVNELCDLSRKQIAKQATRDHDRRRADARRSVPGEGAVGALRQYDEVTSEFLAAVLRERVRLGRVPTLVEGFRLAKTLGWEKEK